MFCGHLGISSPYTRTGTTVEPVAFLEMKEKKKEKKEKLTAFVKEKNYLTS